MAATERGLYICGIVAGTERSKSKMISGQVRNRRNALHAVLLVSVMSVIVGCKQEEDPLDPVVARAYDHVMTRSELRNKLPAGYNPKDSARLADQIITNWIRDRVILQLADKNLSEEQKDFSAELTDYRNSLLTYAYERAMVRQNLDTAVTEAEVENYYQTNGRNFKLESIIVRLRFVKLSQNAPDIEKLKKWFRSDNEDDYEKIEEYCRKYADNYFLDEGTWLYLDDFLKEVPLPVIDWDSFLDHTTYYEYSSGTHLYLVRFYGFRLRGDTPPLTLVERRIKELILNKRKVDFIKEMREKAVNEAYAQKNVEWIK